jgi:hypothetical protein
VTRGNHLADVERVDREPVCLPHVLRHLLDEDRLVSRLRLVPAVGETADAEEGI